MPKKIIITESQFKRFIKRQILSENGYGQDEIGEIACCINDDGDYDVELFDAETYHRCGYEVMTLDEIEENFGSQIANEVKTECADGKEHRYELAMYDNETIDLTNKQALSTAAMQRLRHGEYTRNCRGFILPNGVTVYTDAEHNMCSQIPGVKGTFHFIELGCIRVLDHSVDLAVTPTSEQWQTLWDVFNAYYGDTMYLDLMNKQIGTASKQYSELDPQEAIDDIRNYFNHGVKPKSNTYRMYESVFRGKKKTLTNLNESNLPQTNLLQQFEKKYGITLSDNGRRWFMGLVNGTPFGLNMDTILTKAAFYLLGVNPFPIGQDVDNEWDELDGILRIIIEKTGFGSQILERLRESKQNEEMYISENEMAEFEKRLQYYPNLLKELKRCYYVFSTLAPVVYKAKNYLRTYKKGLPALEFCFVVGAIKEKERAATDVAISKALSLPNVSLSLPGRNAINENINLYHGTRADFNKFDTAYLLSGIGEMAHGYGFYLTNSKATANDYAAGGQVLTVEVPDGKYLDGESIKPSEALSIARKFFKYYLNTEYGQTAYKGMENDFWKYECSAIAESPNGEYIYNTISTFLDSDKEASEWLRGIGYVGMKLPTENGRTGEPFVNYLIFDPEDIKIIKKEKQ